MSRVIFLSHIVDEKTPLYGGKAGIKLRQTRSIKNGDVCNEMSWKFGDHTGTHVDAPKHFYDRGRTVDAFPPNAWAFEHVALVDLSHDKLGAMIGADDIGRPRLGTELLLLRIGWERFRGHKRYWQDYPGVHPDLSEWLRKVCPSIEAVGVDTISISSPRDRKAGRAAHRAFLSRGVVLIEDMKLSILKAAPRKVVVAPVRVKGADAAPCTVFAWSR